MANRLLKNILNNAFCFLKRLRLSIKNRRGYVMIIVACFLPIVLAGITYSEKLFHSKDKAIKDTTVIDEITKRCAREAALEVAKNWNPGLTLGQQRDGIYKVADAVYNNHPAFSKSILSSTVPGISLSDKLGISIFSNNSEAKQVNYTATNKYYSDYYIQRESGGTLWNPYYALWTSVDKASAPNLRQSIFDEMDETKLANKQFVLQQHNIFQDACPSLTSDQNNTYGSRTHPNNTYCFPGCHTHSMVIMKLFSTSNTTDFTYSPKSTSFSGLPYFYMTSISTSTLKYQKRDVPLETIPLETDNVQVMIQDDKIKVRTNNQVGYAVPAKCNLDIVLAIPVNGAACNVNNRDAASDTAGTPYYSSSVVVSPASSVGSTPLYQMGQACKNFIKDNFYHTNGVYVSLIPYSAKLSIPLNRATSWTVAFPKFIDTSTTVQKMIGACLYATSGEKDAKLTQDYKTRALVSNDTLPTTDTPYFWGGYLTGCPIMFRRGSQSTGSSYGNNYYYSGYLNYTNDPTTSAAYKYLRMNLNPCYGGYANTLAMRCERACTHFLPNPYYIIEPTADLVKIYEMCNALYPIADTRNVSNFLFLPLEWAMNFFQSWTNDPQCAAVSGTGTYSASSASTAVLSRQSKTTSGRKKAIILLVNKPDHFEPGELTYLGFDNDASEFPTVESDKIDFSINYGDTSKRYLDGTAYSSSVIAGPKKILKYTTQSGTVSYDSSTSLYECPRNATCRLTFPKRRYLRLVVDKRNTSSSLQWVKRTSGTSYDLDCVKYCNGVFLAGGD
ncbi:MAG: hypothetical protein IJ730_04305 [Alphaproteobacteria bacterium]|nr:hypothetical protein [Alphaproteobacteria bacterium]